ncbi:MAG: hypothetical protein HN509_06770 [Halobacteriovoraceae bacterium]|jgi:type II secretory pathway component GspD/PulD (secretin)|nr:hypothetical protein [Halobacteriovoraceae bacterium]
MKKTRMIKTFMFLGLMLLISCSKFKRKELRPSKRIENLLFGRKPCITKVKREKVFEFDFGIYDPTPKKKYSFQFLDGSIREALMELSSTSGIPIVFDESVSGILSIEIRKKSFLKSLELITSSGPYDFKKEKGYFFVGLSDEKSESWWKLNYQHNYKLKNLNAIDLIKQLSPKHQAFISSEPGQNTISISAPRKILKSIAYEIYRLDKEKAQIQLGITISELSSRAKEYVGGLLASDNIKYPPTTTIITQ